jgi:16S rRNA (cytidine1402-2'-O)-methyltransferase
MDALRLDVMPLVVGWLWSIMYRAVSALRIPDRWRVMSHLYMVGPIGGDWRDLSLRAQRILREASLIMTQDVRSTRKWLEQGDICTPAIEVGHEDAASSVLSALRTGDVAWLVVGLADLSSAARQLLMGLSEQGIELLTAPGPSGVVSRWVVSGLPTDSLTFLGVLPGDFRERRAMLESVAYEPQTLVCEFPAEHLGEATRDVVACLGDRRVALHGEWGVWRGQASQAAARAGGAWFTLVIDGAVQDAAWEDDQVDACIRELLAAGGSARDVAREVSQRSGWPRRRVYRLVVSVHTED